MTPKEKAEFLVLEFMRVPADEWFNKNIAKQCVLISVDMILSQCWDYRDIDLQKSFDYWREVKQHIEQL